MINNLIGKRIQLRREEIGISQEQLAKIVGLSAISISYIETGRNAPSMRNFIKITNALKSSADVLLVDVLEYSYKVQASRLGELMEKTHPDKHEQIFNVIEAMLK